MTDRNTWQQFFDAHAPVYMQNCFTTNTVKEVDFVIEELGLAPGNRILDVGCGTGRHSVELAGRGYRMTGVDQSPGMLAEARKAAQAAGMEAEWVQADARQFSRENAFDGAICLCEGAFGLLESTAEAIEQPLAILRNIHRSLKPGGKAVFTVLNGFKAIRKITPEQVEEGKLDLLTLSETYSMQPNPDQPPVQVRERSFVPGELALLFHVAGLKPLHFWGGTAGAWNRKTIGLDEFEIMVVAVKEGPGR